MSERAPTFTQRLTRRKAVWWDDPPRRAREVLHRWRERRTLRRSGDADERWRCCEHWQRTLLNKWNAREFALRNGGRVPRLYWSGRAPSATLLRSLPSRFVIRPHWGDSRRGVFVVVDGMELLRREPMSVAQLGAAAPRTPLLIEEFVSTEGERPTLPVEYKCHTFGDTVAAVEVIERACVREAKHRYYSTAWQPMLDAMNTCLPLAEPREPPRCLDEMLRLAARLGSSVGTYLRVDFFATEAGSIFNEFASTPVRAFTPYCDDLLGALWQEKFPHAT